jgi:NitT/TauT family transport system substrate-binding protein
MSLKHSWFLRHIVLIAIFLGGTGCAPSPAKTGQTTPTPAAVTEVRLINPMGPVVIPITGITSGNTKSDLKIDVQYWKTVDEATGLLAGDEVQFAVLPVSTGVNMAASGIDLALLAVHEWKAFYLVGSAGQTFNGWASLVGKTVYTPESKGQTVDVLTRYALSKANIVPDRDVTFAYAPAQEIVALFKEGKLDFAALPEPYVTMAVASGKGKIVLDYQDYWSQISASKHGIPIAGLFVKQQFLAQHPAETRAVAQALATSTQWANANPKAAIQAGAEVLPIAATVMEPALKRLVFDYVPATDAKDEVLTFLKTMQETYPEGVQKIPDERFFAQ